MKTIYSFLFDHRMSGNYIHVKSILDTLSTKYNFVVFSTGKSSLSNKILLNLRHRFKSFYLLDVICNVFVISWAYLVDRYWHKKQVVLFHVFGGANIAPIIAARVLGVPVVWTLLEVTSQYSQLVKIGLYILKGHKHQVTVVAHAIVPAYGLKDALYIPCSVDRDFWQEQCSRNTGPDSVISLVAVGNINPLKGYEVLLGALLKSPRIFTLSIVGAPLHTQKEYSLKLIELADKIHLKNRLNKVNFLGLCNSQKIKSLIVDCDIFVMPSLSEAAPIALLEAMSVGCYCVASSVGDIPAFLSDYGRGEIFPPGDVDALSRIIDLYSREDAYSVRTSFPVEFTIKSMAKKYDLAFKAMQ